MLLQSFDTNTPAADEQRICTSKPKTEYRNRKGGVSHSHTGRTGTPLFLCPHVTQ